MNEAPRAFALARERDTERLGEALAERLRAEPAQLSRIWLQGELGTGKTTLVRAMLRALGVSGLIRSPTFAIVERYRPDIANAPLTLCHVDLYRLADEARVAELGLGDELEAGASLLIEWPEHGASALGEPDLHIRLDYDGAGRSAALSGASPAISRWIGSLHL